MGRIISFRGLAESGDIIKLNMSTVDGKTGYKIRKFQIFPHKPGTQDAEDVMKIFKTDPDAANRVMPGLGIVDFSDQRLIAAAFLAAGASIAYSSSEVVVFDSEKVNQNLHFNFRILPVMVLVALLVLVIKIPNIYTMVEGLLLDTRVVAYAEAQETRGSEIKKNREIRNICKYFSWNIVKLIRIQYGPYKLGNLKEGKIEEVKVIKDA